MVKIEPAPAPIDPSVMAANDDSANSHVEVVAEGSNDKPEGDMIVAKGESKPKSKAKAGSKDRDDQARLRKKRKTRVASKPAKSK